MLSVKSLANVLHTILQDGVTTDTLIFAYKRNNIWEHVQSADMIVLVRTVTKQLKIHHQDIDPELVGAHSI